MPERLGVLELVTSLEGSEALTKINKLHRTDIQLVSAYIAEYAHAKSPYHSGDERVTVWVGRAENSNAGAELIKRMLQTIEKGGSVFSNLQQLTITDHDVFRVDGPGGEHFFYNSKELRERVVWLTIEATDTMPILEQAVKTF